MRLMPTLAAAVARTIRRLGGRLVAGALTVTADPTAQIRVP